MGKTIYSIEQISVGTPNYVETVTPLSITAELQDAVVYENEGDGISAATYLNSLGDGNTYQLVGRPDDRHPHS